MRRARCASWLLAAIGSAVILGWLATKAGSVFAPLLVYPAMTGLALGALLASGMRLLEAAHRASLLAGATAAALVLVGAQHYFSYLDAQRVARDQSAQLKIAEQAFPELAARQAVKGESFAGFLRDSARHGVLIAGVELGATGVWTLWGLNAAITVAATLAVVAVALRRPFCDACGSWYRVSRSGQLDAEQVATITAAIGLLDCPARTARYRLWSCRSGCGPTGCELSWNERGLPRRTAWLDRAARTAITAILDHNPQSKSPP
jgi:hypothetical protein